MKGRTKGIVAISLVLVVGIALYVALGPQVSRPESPPLFPRVGFVKPTFTAAAYHSLYAPPSFPDSFYKFYTDHASDPLGSNITTELGLLTSNVTRADSIVTTSQQRSEYRFLSLANETEGLLSPLSATVLTDADVDQGAIFQNGTGDMENAYQVLVLAHQEYVTGGEYHNLERFVSNGGVLVLIDGDVFASVVNYNATTKSIRFVAGHGWAYNGRTAWRTSLDPWAAENLGFIGSDHCNPALGDANFTLTNNTFGYNVRVGEEQCVSGRGNQILANYGSSDSRYVIGTYSRDYGKGRVYSISLYGEDLLYNVRFLDLFNKIIEDALATFTFKESTSTCSISLTPQSFSQAEAWNFEPMTRPALSNSSSTFTFRGTSNSGGGLGVLISYGSDISLGDTLLVNLSSSTAGLFEVFLYDNPTTPRDALSWTVPVNSGTQQLEMPVSDGQVQGGFQMGTVSAILFALKVQPNQTASFTVGPLQTENLKACLE